MATSQDHANPQRHPPEIMNRGSRPSRFSPRGESPQPSMSDFDPENEAIMSTRQLDKNPQRIPELRASAQKYSRFSRPSRSEAAARSEPDYAINTSAIGRAFPDFSQGGTSSDDSSISIEVGRGANKQHEIVDSRNRRSGNLSSDAQLDLDEDSLDFAAPLIGKYEVTSTPPLHLESPRQHNPDTRSTRLAHQSRQASALRHEVKGLSIPSTKTKDYGSGASSGKSSGDHGRTLAAMHSRVNDGYDMSRISDDRPPTIDITIKNTRFGNARQTFGDTNDPPTTYSSSRGLTSGSHSRRKAKATYVSNSNHGTQQSFLLPDMPNMSELVSGVYEDRTPIASRNGKGRVPRPSHQSRNDKGHADVREVPVPEDEQAIFLSLKLLQDKIVLLERHQIEAEEVIRDLQQRNRSLEAGETVHRKVSHRSDSALGTTDSDGDELNGNRKLTIEKNRLESSVRALQAQLDAAGRRASTTDTILHSVINERDSAVSQLHVAYASIESLRVENENLRDEIRKLKAHDTRPSQNVKELPNLTADRTRPSKKGKATAQGSADKETTTTRKDDLTHPNFEDDLDMQVAAPESAKKGSRPVFTLHSKENSSSRAQRRDDDDTDDSEVSSRQVRGTRKREKSPNGSRSRPRGDTEEDESRDLTYLSFQDSGEVAKLRKQLERELLERKKRQGQGRQQVQEDPTMTQASQYTIKTEASLPRRSSMKNLTSKNHEDSKPIEQKLSGKSTSEHNRRHSDTSMISARDQRRNMLAENLTSAFILPDITIRNPGTFDACAPDVLNVVHADEAGQLGPGCGSRHDNHHCTICKGNAIGKERHNDHGTAKPTIRIPKPVPVSERLPPAGLYEEEHTIRPSQTPGLALATVLKGIEDEIAHLKMQLSTYQSLYNGHDPSLSKRKRISVYEKMAGLMQTIEIKSEQVYALYDVLEGQKQDGHEITEQEVETTLQSVGVDAARLRPQAERKAKVENSNAKANGREPWDLTSDDEDDEDLPWEGIDTTVETTKSGRARTNSKRDVAA